MKQQAKLNILRVLSAYKYGYEAPKNYKDAQRLDEKNKNTKWMDSNKLEHKQLAEYDLFIDKGPFAGCMISQGYQFI